MQKHLAFFFLLELMNTVRSVDPCESQTHDEDDYNLSLQIASVFIQIGVSFISVVIPQILVRCKCSTESGKTNKIITGLQFFGSGIIVCTAFCHLLPSCFKRFLNPCLSGVWADYGAPWIGVFALTAIFGMQLIEFVSLCKIDQIAANKKNTELRDTAGVELPKDSCTDDNPSHGHVHGLIEFDGKGLSLYILEFGIALHSVLVGIAVGQTSGSQFLAITIALIFHQAFEGLALGARIVKQTFSVMKALGMCAIYGLSTPLGIAIGIGIRFSYNPNSQRAIVVMSLLEAMAAGMLIYNALVGLISSEMNADPEFRKSSFKNKIYCFGSMYAGTVAMAIVGNWA